MNAAGPRDVPTSLPPCRTPGLQSKPEVAGLLYGFPKPQPWLHSQRKTYAVAKLPRPPTDVGLHAKRPPADGMHTPKGAAGTTGSAQHSMLKPVGFQANRRSLPALATLVKLARPLDRGPGSAAAS